MKKILNNFFTNIRKVGILEKKSNGFFGSWQRRFTVLTNAGLVYFKVDVMKNKDDLQPQNFKPLTDFVLQSVSEAVSSVKLHGSNPVFLYRKIGGWPPPLFPHNLH